MAARAREPVHEGLGVRAVAEREGGQVEPGRPALGALDQPRHQLVGQAHPGGRQQGVRFGVAERQLRGPQLRELPVGPPAAEGQRRIRPGSQGQLAARGEPLGQVADGDVTAPLGHQVQVIQHQDERLAARGAGVDQRRQHHLLQRRHAGVEAVADRRIQAHDRTEGGQHAGDEGHRVVVDGLQRDPGKGPLVALAPQRQQRRLAIAGRRRHQHDRGMGGGHQAVEPDGDA